MKLPGPAGRNTVDADVSGSGRMQEAPAGGLERDRDAERLRNELDEPLGVVEVGRAGTPRQPETASSPITTAEIRCGSATGDGRIPANRPPSAPPPSGGDCGR